MSLSWFKKTFNNYGVVKDAFIPEKRSKISGRKFGFVRYSCSISADVAIAKANGLWCEGKKLFVKLASFDQNHLRNSMEARKGVHNNSGAEAYHHIGRVREATTLGENNLKEVAGHRGSNPNSATVLKSYAQILKGDLSGKVEKAYEIAKILTISPTNFEWLSRSVVAELNKTIAIEDLYEVLRLESFNSDVKIRSMGEDL